MSTSRKMVFPRTPQASRLVIAVVCLVLAVTTALVFSPVARHGFLNLDDNRYVYDNPHIRAGITPESLKYAFSFDVSNWHPLTWLSLMIDFQFFGLDPSGYHVVNLGFHILNVLFLFWVLHRMTQAVWPSAFVAAAFALHPLHVESVAWIAQRKDVLSGLFWILTMGTYTLYVEKPGYRRYVFTLLFFIFGLMSKPIVVTLPFALLLVDFWPLRRFDPVKWAGIRLALLEKIPFFLLAFFSCLLTYSAQKQGGAVQTWEAISLGARLGNAVTSYVAYLGKMIWPVSLAVLYPHPGSVPLGQIVGSALILIAATALVLWRAPKAPYLAVGWFWFLGTLVPVIGLVQVGAQGMADRYTYLPFIGLFILAAWGACDLAKSLKIPNAILATIAVSILGAFMFATYRQVRYWKDNLTLYDHTLAVTQNNWLILNNRGNVYNGQGDYRRAIEDYNRAIHIKPDYAEAFVNRGAAYNGLEQFNHAIADFSRAIELRPAYAEAYLNRGAAYNNLGKHRLAIDDLNKGIAIKPGYAEAYFSRAVAQNARRRYREAIEDFTRAIALKPAYTEAYFQRGVLSFQQGDIDSGCRDAQNVCRLGNCDLLQVAQSNGYCR